MSKIYFICGFIGSGKTSYAKLLAKQQAAFRFSIDEWMIPLYGEHMEREVFDARIKTVENLFKQAALQMQTLGLSVIFDFGFWKANERQAILHWAGQHGFEAEMIYLDVPYEECCKRAARRNADLGEQAYEMTPEMLALFWSWFDVPTEEERLSVISTAAGINSSF